jgi:hypothetical protein
MSASTNSKNFAMRLVQLVSAKLARPLQDFEMEFVLGELKKEDIARFQHLSQSQLSEVLSSTYSGRLQALQCKAPVIDMKKYMHDEMLNIPLERNNMQKNKTQVKNAFAQDVAVSNVFGVTNLTDLLRLISPDKVKAYASVVLCSEYRLLDANSSALFKWNYSNSVTPGQGMFNSTHNIRNITGLRVSDLRLPLVEGLNGDSGRISLLFHEFSSVGAITPKRNWQFLFAAERDGNYVNLTSEGFQEHFFQFATPIPSISSLTVSFGNPFQQINFDADRMSCQVNIGTTTEFICPSEHKLTTGDIVFIQLFQPSSNRHSFLANSVNSTSGHDIVRVSDTLFSIDVDSTELLQSGSGTVTTMTGSPIVLGTGTLFSTFLNTSDSILINNTLYNIASIQSDSQITLASPAIEAVTSTYSRDNRIKNNCQVIFDSKTFMIPVEIEYLL